MSFIARSDEAVSETARLRRLLNEVDEKINDAIHAYDTGHKPTAEMLLDEAHCAMGRIREIIL